MKHRVFSRFSSWPVPVDERPAFAGCMSASLGFALSAWLLAGCGGALSDPLADGAQVEGRAVDRAGAVVQGIGAYLVEDGVVVRRTVTGRDGRFRFPLPLGPYQVILHDGEGNGHFTEPREGAQSAGLGNVETLPLTRWPAVVDVHGIGYAERLTDFPGGLVEVRTGRFRWPPHNLFLRPSEAGGRGALYRLEPETGALVLLHEEIIAEGTILNDWLVKGPDPSGRPHHEALMTMDGRLIHTGATFVPIGEDDDRYWFVEPVEYELDQFGALVVYDYRVIRVDRNGGLLTGPPILDQRDRRRTVCAGLAFDVITFDISDDNDTCDSSRGYVVDPETLELEPLTVPDRVRPPRGYSAFEHDGRLYLLSTDGTQLFRWFPDEDRREQQMWFDCRSCPPGEPMVTWFYDGVLVMRLADDAGLQIGVRIADVQAQRSDWFDSEIEVGGTPARVVIDQWQQWQMGIEIIEGRVLFAAAVRTETGERTLLITWGGDGWQAELLPWAYCGTLPTVSPTGRWLMLAMLDESNRCNLRHRVVDAPRSRFERTAFLEARSWFRFVDNDSTMLSLFVDPITGQSQLFRRRLAEVAQ